MTAISFELSEQEASSLRHQADEAHMTVSAFLRDLVSKKENKKKEEVVIGIKKNRFTNTPAFYVKKGKLPPLTVESVKAMLADFP